MSVKLADDFDSIRGRMEELKRERERAIASQDLPQHIDVDESNGQNAPTGGCVRCAFKSVFDFGLGEFVTQCQTCGMRQGQPCAGHP